MKRAKSFFIPLFVGVITGAVYFSHQLYTIYGGDAGDLVAAIATTGVAHPPGYPFYTVLGILLNRLIPLGTPAWRVAFLSSIPSVLALVLLNIFLYKVSGNYWASFLSVLILAFAYPFFLYSVAVEVFALNNLFTVSLILLIYLFEKTGRIKFLYSTALILGFSLTHHHIIVFLLPALVVLSYDKIKMISGRQILKSMILFLLGLSPYIYVFLSAAAFPKINWLERPSLVSFFRLFFRSVYGTFSAGKFVNQLTLSRLLSLLAFVDFYRQDISWVGVILTILGIFHLTFIRRDKNLFRFFLIAFLSYLFFLFYASFPLGDNFMLATFERFLLPLYIILTIPLTLGLVMVEVIFRKIFSKVLYNLSADKTIRMLSGLFILVPIFLFYKNHLRVYPLKQDFSAENFATDILGSVDKNGILIISSDTPLFDTQYLYYGENIRQDIMLIHFGKLYTPDSVNQLKRVYPRLHLSKVIEGTEDLEEFLIENSRYFPVYCNQDFVLERGSWIPRGLVYRYQPPGKNEDVSAEIDQMEKVWSIYHDPLSGSLSGFQNLYLSDILKMYAYSHQETAFYEAKNGWYDLAKPHLLSAKKLAPWDSDSGLILAQIYIRESHCKEAEDEIKSVISLDNKNREAYYLRYRNLLDCYKDTQQAEKYFKIYQDLLESKETPLKQL